MRILFLLLTIPFITFGQINNKGHLFFIRNFSFEQYNAARQNWSIVQDNRGIIYVANSSGYILEFDGINWTKIPVAKVSIRSLAVDKNNKIYVGTKNSFGYLKIQPNGKRKFVNLSENLPKEYKETGTIKQIVINDSIVYFLTEMFIYIYKTKSKKLLIIDINDYVKKDIFTKMFHIDNKIFIALKKNGLFTIKNDTIEFVKNSTKLNNSFIRGFFKFNGKYIISSYEKGLFLYENQDFIPYKTPIDDIIINNHYFALPLDNQHLIFALGTGGFIIVNKNFNIINFVNSSNGLLNDRILNIYIDLNNSIWLALDNGIAVIYPYYPCTIYDNSYRIAKDTRVYTELLYNNNLYLGTSSGIYMKNWKTQDFIKKYNPLIQKNNIVIQEFTPIKDYSGIFKISKLDTIKNKIFFSSSFGLGYIKNNSAHYLIKKHTIRNFTPTNNQNRILAISNSLTVLKYSKDSAKWYRKKTFENIKGKIILQDSLNNFWVVSSANGIFKIKFSQDLSEIISVKKYDNYSGLHGLPAQENNKIFKFNNQLYFTTIKGIYKYDYNKDSFYVDTLLNKLIGGNYFVNLLYVDKEGNFWIKYNYKEKDKDIWRLVQLKKTDTGYILVKNIFNPLINKIYSFFQLTDKEYIIGTDNGFVYYDASKKIPTYKFNAYIRKIQTINPDSLIAYDIDTIKNKDTIPKLKYKLRNIKFYFGASSYFDPNIEFSYMLEGYDKQWTDWSTQSIKEYSNLPYGKYTFKLKARNILNQESKIVEFSFIILPPWYLSTWAIILYVALGGLTIWLIVYLYTLRLKRQKEHLEKIVKQRTKEIEKQKNILEKQNKEIFQKNREITDSINYAQRIQNAILPLEKNLAEHVDDYFIFFKPRDIVSGDFYWFAVKNNKIIIAAVDCTGHGVPGAFMSILGIETLNNIILGMGITDPKEILQMQDKLIKKALKQQTSETKDGMDMAICVIDKQNKTLEFAGAKNPLIYIKDNKLYEIKGSKKGIGDEVNIPFEKHIINIDQTTWFYIFSDGYKDQFGGGKKMRKFMKRFFYQLLLNIHKLNGTEQKIKLEQTLKNWMTGYNQTDDIIIIGFKLS